MWLASIVLTTGFAAATLTGLHRRAVSQGLYDDLVFYYQYASTAYAPLGSCTQPNGNTLVGTFSNITSLSISAVGNVVIDTQGFVARDDVRREIVVAFRGSSSVQDFLIDATLVPLPFASPGARPPFGTLVHTGFTLAYNSVVGSVLALVRAQVSQYPDYTLVSTGHSLGGALSSVGAVSLKGNFPNQPIRLYNYGSPRVGNFFFAEWVNNRVGRRNSFRVVHTTDTVPSVPPRALLYRHHATEYWLMPDPPSPANTKQCDSSGEDPTCSASLILGTGIYTEHVNYFGIRAGSVFCT